MGNLTREENINNHYIDESEESSDININYDNSMDSDNEQIPKRNATTGVNAEDTKSENMDDTKQTDSSNPSPQQPPKGNNDASIEEEHPNGWNYDAEKTITIWYETFKKLSFIYQWVLDRNRKRSDQLAAISILSSGALGVFSGFKLWIDNDELFQTVSNIILMLLNFVVAIITSMSKRYIDDKRNETIRAYVERIDSFIGQLSAQFLKSPVYRMNAEQFFKKNNNTYTKLISSAPNLSITEINDAMYEYEKYKSHNYTV